LIIGFKEYCALLFCKGVLLKDAKGILIKPGENTQAARQNSLHQCPGNSWDGAHFEAYIH